MILFLTIHQSEPITFLPPFVSKGANSEKVEQKERRDASRAAALEAKRTGGLEALVADAQVKQNQHENAKSFVQSSASHGVTDRSAKGNFVNTTDEPGLLAHGRPNI